MLNLKIKNPAKFPIKSAGKKVSPKNFVLASSIAKIATRTPNKYLKFPVASEVIGSGNITNAKSMTDNGKL